MNHNLRSRALIFSLFYHPILAVKAILSAAFRKGARSVLIQAEYDRWFFGGCTLDELPSVSPLSTADDRAVLTGPKLILNATSLNTGERRGFSRDANTRLADLKTSNKNVLKLSQVVGASSGVPVLFPPTPVLEDLLVDGGVGDNQGIEGLRECGCNPLIISDASGQLELAHRQGTGEAEVFMRTNEILQHQVRNKLLDALSAEYELRKSGTDALEFAFFHLYLNLKDDPKIVHRTAYAVLFPFWALLRRLTAGLDVLRYRALTKADWSLDWSEKGATTPATAGYQGHGPG